MLDIYFCTQKKKKIFSCFFYERKKNKKDILSKKERYLVDFLFLSNWCYFNHREAVNHACFSIFNYFRHVWGYRSSIFYANNNH